jgi:23S rRNA pseudouridine2605 synthase
VVVARDSRACGCWRRCARGGRPAGGSDGGGFAAGGRGIAAGCSHAGGESRRGARVREANRGRERQGGGGGSTAGGCRGSADEGDERGLGLERRAAEELVEAREEPPEVRGEVVGGLRGLDDGGGGERGGQLRALVRLMEYGVGERSQRRGTCRGADERGAHGGGRVPDAAQRGGQEPGSLGHRAGAEGMDPSHRARMQISLSSLE